jgi:hypothetical protein
MTGSPLLERLKKIQNDVVAPHARHYAKLQHLNKAPGQQNSTDLATLFCTIQTKQLHPASKLDHICRKSSTGIGQLMFISMQGYHMGNSDRLFLWQPSGVASVHFQLSIEWRGRPPKPGFKLMLSQRSTPIFFDWITFDEEASISFYSFSAMEIPCQNALIKHKLSVMCSLFCSIRLISSLKWTLKRLPWLLNADTIHSGQHMFQVFSQTLNMS